MITNNATTVVCLALAFAIVVSLQAIGVFG